MEPTVLLRSLAALLLVLGLLAALAWLARRLDLARRLGSARRGASRLALIESRWLDSRTRLLLVRCDEAEHLVLVTPSAAVQLDSRGGSPQAFLS